MYAREIYIYFLGPCTKALKPTASKYCCPKKLANGKQTIQSETEESLKRYLLIFSPPWWTNETRLLALNQAPQLEHRPDHDDTQ